jgi:hypothetical protein
MPLMIRCMTEIAHRLGVAVQVGRDLAGGLLVAAGQQEVLAAGREARREPHRSSAAPRSLITPSWVRMIDPSGLSRSAAAEPRLPCRSLLDLNDQVKHNA